MKNVLNFILIFFALFLFPFAGFGRGTDTSGEYVKSSTVDFDALEKNNPDFVKFEKQLQNIRLDIERTVKEYQEKIITRQKAKERLIQLLKERQAIMNSSEYIAEKLLSSRSIKNY